MTKTQTRILKLYTPHEAQLKIHLSQARYRVAAYGRQAGKSTFAVNELLAKAWAYPGTRYWFVSPVSSQALVQFRRCLGMLMKCKGIMLSRNKTEKRIKLVNQSELVFVSGECFDNLRSETLHGVVIDEVRDQSPDLWPMVIKPMLLTTKGFAVFISTPDGFDQFYDFFQRATTNKSWESFTAPSTANPMISQKEMQEAKSEMSEDQFAQEYMAEFRDIGTGSCYSTFGQHNILDQNPFADAGQAYSPHLPILVGMDFNLSPMCWILGQAKHRDLYWQEEICQVRADAGLSPTQSAAEDLIRRVRGHKAGVVLIGDASGKAGQRSAPGGQSDYDTIKQALRAADVTFQDKTPDCNPGIKDRVNTVCAALRAADGSVHMWFNNQCKVAIKDMRRRAWKIGGASLAFDNSNHQIGHMSDAQGYACCVIAPIKGVGNRATMQIISRSF